jgi:hypothetical protein
VKPTQQIWESPEFKRRFEENVVPVEGTKHARWKGRAGFPAGSIQWELRHHQRVPEGHEVFATCGDETCCGRDHVALRNRRPKSELHQGQNNGMAKLTVEDVESARHLFEGGYSYKELAEMFKVKYPTIYNAIRGFKWKHLRSENEEQNNGEAPGAPQADPGNPEETVPVGSDSGS